MIPGWLVAIVTFPGVIVHEAAHLFFCKLRRVAVLEACFFRFGNPVGYVIHEETKDFTTTFLITIGPFLINSLLCILFCFPAFFPVKAFGQSGVLSYFMIWLGISIGMHAFPSTQDAKNLWRAAKAAMAGRKPLALLGFPVVGIIYIANLLTFFWFDYLYGVALGFGLPEIILKRLV